MEFNVYRVLWDGLYDAMQQFDAEDTLTIGRIVELMDGMKTHVADELEEYIEKGFIKF